MLLSLKNLLSNSYFGFEEFNKSPYKPYINNISETKSELPVVTNIVPFARYYSEVGNLNLNFLPHRMSSDSSATLLKNGFWEFHMHGPFDFFTTLEPEFKAKFEEVGEAKFDVISFIKL